MIRLATLSISSLILAAVAIAVPPQNDLPTDSWGVKVDKIPDILRMHCPPLRGDVGVLITQVLPDSPAARTGLRPGDVVLDVQGVPVESASELPNPAGLFQPPRIRVLREGRVHNLGQPFLAAGPNQSGDQIKQMVEQMMRQSRRQAEAMVPSIAVPPGYATMPRTGAYASSSAMGSESMSVSRANDQISIEMSSSDGGGTIRLQGTMDEIEQQMQAQQLSPETRNKVRRALGQ